VGRPKKYDRDQVLERAMETFWRQGYEATSTADLEQQMGLNRSSLYAEFRSKHELYEAALDRYLDTVVPRFIGELSEPGAGVDAVETVLERFAAWAGTPGTEGGCMICNAATETATDDSSSRGVVQRYVTGLEAGFLNALDNAVARGELGSGIDTVGWSRKLATTLLGMMVLIRARVDPTLAREAARMAMRELTAFTPTG
jgi:TetR/AcrR family transcriptional repressor of nem operon